MAQSPQQPSRPSQAPKAGANPGPHSPDVERALALRDVMDHAVKVQQEITKPTRIGPRRRTWLAVLCIPAIAVSAYSWLARPELIWGPRPVPVAAERRAADLRFSMFLLARRVEAYRRASGHLPAALREIGTVPAGIAFSKLSDSTFEIRSTAGGEDLVYRSDAPLGAFLGKAPSIIAGPSR